MRCCVNCFDDPGLSDLLASYPFSLGRCDYCNSEVAVTVEPHELNDLFTTVTNIYEEASDGEKLVHWFREDWAMFTRLEYEKAEELLAAILEDSSMVKKKYRPSNSYESTALKDWNDLCEELRTNNRYFPDVELDSSRLDELLELLQAKDMPDNSSKN